MYKMYQQEKTPKQQARNKKN